MIIDARRGFGASAARYDVCIVGGGAAGISLALALEDAALRVCLLEAGGADYSRPAQDLMSGEVDGSPYPPLRDTRLCALGGTTGVWAGWCRPLEPVDFESRGDPAGGWPFGPDELEPCYRRAHELCGLGRFDYAVDGWAPQLGTDTLLPGDDTFVDRIFLVNRQRFGDRYRPALERSRHVDVLLHAPVTRLVAAPSGGAIAAVEVRDPHGHSFTIAAARFVLAAGGIENPRLLLLSADSEAAAPGNGGGLVGRCFTDHLFVDFGTLVLRDAPRTLRFYQPAPVTSAQGALAVRGVLALRDGVVRETKLGNAALFFHPRYESHPAYEHEAVRALLRAWARMGDRAVPGGVLPDLARAVKAPRQIAVALLRKLLVRGGPAARWRMRGMFECEPRLGNRVRLGDDRDALGRRRARLEWSVSERDVAGMRHVTAAFAECVRRAGVGRLERAFADEPAAWRAAAEGGKHHIGTTRMHRDPESGVVDPDCRVHGLSNLYVAGSSVFPSGGYVNPTLTIVALAVRLADHLRAAAETGLEP